tara:strand:- start:127 stop:519 length:393 start_codon:yes stop_codon:yes gene_type:complete
MSLIKTNLLNDQRAYEVWFDSKSETTQELIESISDRTSYIIDEEDYDAFIEELANYGVGEFEDAFAGEFEGYGERVFTEFSQQLIEDLGYDIEPDFIANCIDWELVWHSYLRFDYTTFEFKGNTYFFRVM